MRHSFTRFFLDIDKRIVDIRESVKAAAAEDQKRMERQLLDYELIRSQMDIITTEIAAMCNISGKVELQAIPLN
ncbi:hypothetical protein D3C78_1887520 [compost metagenome]